MGKDNVYYAKMASIPLIFTLVALSASLPWIFSRLKRTKSLMIFFVCFSAGAMFGIGLLHMIPESREIWEAYYGGHDHHDHDHDHDHDDHDHDHLRTILRHGGEGEMYPYTELLAGITVIFLVAVEHFLARYLARKNNLDRGYTNKNDHGHSHAQGAFEDDDDDDEQDDVDHTHSGDAQSLLINDDNASNQPKYLVGVPKNGSHDYIVIESSSSSVLPLFNSVPNASTIRALVDKAQLAGSPPKLQGVMVQGSLNLAPGSQLLSNDDAYVSLATTPNDGLSDYAAGETAMTVTIGNAPDCIKNRSLVAEDSDVEWYYYYEDEQRSMAKLLDLQKRQIDAFIASLAIAVHCIFNGLALGSESPNSARFWTLFAATVGHKFMDGFAVGVPIYRARLSNLVTLIAIAIVAFATPLGVIIGYFSTEHSGLLTRAIIMSLSTGSFFYVALFELFPVGLKSSRSLELKLFCIALGFASMGVIAKWA